MNKSVSLHVATAILAISLSVALFSSFTFAQSATREKPKLKNFGSSLKRLKWDTERNAAVETKRKEDKAKGSEEEDVVRVETSLVVCDVLVLDQRGQSVAGLTQNDFVVTEEGKPQQVGMFSLGDDAKVPRSIVLIIDYSSSQFPFIHTSVQAAKTLIDKLNPRDTMAIVTDEVELLADFTSDKSTLKATLDSLERKSAPYYRTPLKERARSNVYSALMATLKEAFDSEDIRPIVIVQTDGDDIQMLRNPIITPSIPPDVSPEERRAREQTLTGIEEFIRKYQTEFSLDDVYKAAQKSRATIYTITPGYQLIGLTGDEELAQYAAWHRKILLSWEPPGRIKQAEARVSRVSIVNQRIQAELGKKMQSALALLATITGGWANFLSDPAQANEIYSHILSDMNRRYIVGYYPTNKEHDGKRRKLNVEVRGHPEYIVMGRKSYYAAEPDQ
jgi:VWFA-related protein